MSYEQATIEWGRRHLPELVTDGARCADWMHFSSGSYEWDGGPIEFEVGHRPYHCWSEWTEESAFTTVRAKFMLTNGKPCSVSLAHLESDTEYDEVPPYDMGALIRELVEYG